MSPEKFAYDAGREDGRDGRAANSGGFGLDKAALYEAGFRIGRNELWAAIRLLIRTGGEQVPVALRSYLDEKH